MLLLQFEIDGDRYALDTARVLRVLPLVPLKGLPKAPPGVAGILDYGGRPVPAVDLTALALGHSAARYLSTRLVVVGLPAPGRADRPLALVVERATDVVRRPADDFVDAGIAPGGAPYLGPVAADARGMIQLVDVARLLPPEVYEALCGSAEAP